MAQLRNISPDDREVPTITSAVIPADGILEVDDEVFAQYAWPETTWSVVSAPDRAPEHEAMSDDGPDPLEIVQRDLSPEGEE